jgi:hypothetical protein
MKHLECRLLITSQQTGQTGAISEYELIQETIAPVALETITNWILKRTGQH